MLRWSLLTIVTAIILVIRTYRYGFFQGKDWFLYLILFVSIGFVFHYRNKNRTT